jgi:hypothetical protein
MNTVSTYSTRHKGHVPQLETLRPLELWKQDAGNTDLWHHAGGLIVNTAALDERQEYFNIVRIHAPRSHRLQEVVTSPQA